MRAIGSICLLAVIALAFPLSVVPNEGSKEEGLDAAEAPRQGLLGHYYTPHLGDTWIKNDFRGLVEDSYGVSVPAVGKQPDAARVDSQIAFGKGVGFPAPRDPSISPDHASQVVWWPEELVDARPGNRAGAVIWKGYIRLPKAGTYYLATATLGATAVYLNQSRVALKGPHPSGGTIPSEAFSYPETETGEPVQEPSSQYLVPITIDSPRDFPLEVRYTPRHGRPVGIDLYWVTPDSPLDAKGKPIARIVPAEVLFVDPPGPIDTGVTRSESSMISSEFLYFSPAAQGDEFTLSIRLADGKGRPVPGKRVHVSGLVSTKQADIIIQPENPTDENGVTTARVRAGPGYRARHESTFHAADVTDFVDVGQVAHVQFDNTRPSFLPQTYAPYYDDKKFLVEPLPLSIGQPVTIKVPLNNTTQADAELTVIFRNNELNIGAKEWSEIGRVSRIKLRPGESTEASIEWTPREGGKRCFRIDLLAEFPQTRSAFLSLALGVAWAQEDGPSTTLSESLQRNIGMVWPPKCEADPDKLCPALANAERAVEEQVLGPLEGNDEQVIALLNSPELWEKTLSSAKATLDAQLGNVAELACDNSAEHKQIEEMRRRLASLTPGVAQTKPDINSELHEIIGINSGIGGLKDKWCPQAPPPDAAPTDTVTPSDDSSWDPLWDILWFIYGWAKGMLPLPTPPGSDLLDKDLGPLAAEGAMRGPKILKELELRRKGDYEELHRVRKMSHEEFMEEFGRH